jgi:hypothetical protein
MGKGPYFDIKTRPPLHLDQAKCDTADCKQKKWFCGHCDEWLDDSSGVGRRETHLRKKHAGQNLPGRAGLDLPVEAVEELELSSIELSKDDDMWAEKNEFHPIQKERLQELFDENTNVLAQDVFDGSINVLAPKPRTFSEDELNALTSQFLEMDFETTMQVHKKLLTRMAVLQGETPLGKHAPNVVHREENGKSPDSVAMALESASDISGQKSGSIAHLGRKFDAVTTPKIQSKTFEMSTV